jgi:cyclic dehypoxanthinyl futalosine synthase
VSAVGEILEKARAGERISDAEAVELLRSRDLVAVGRAANEIRNRKHDPERVTFIIDRNLNYTNVCTTDCDFCAFYRRPGDVREGYLLPKPVIFKKIEETLALGGTGLLMQGGHHPDLGSTTTRISSRRSRRATRSTCTRSRRRRSCTRRAGRS